MHNGIKTFLANDLSTIFIKRKPMFWNGSKTVLRNPPYYPILYHWAFDNFILDVDLFAKALQCFKTCVLINNN